MGMGYEFLDAKPEHRFELPGGVVMYSDSYDIVADATAAARDAQAKLKAPSVKPGKYDLVLDPSHLFLTIHESVGHPLELDRVLGYEANYAGTSFATLDKWRAKDFRYGSDQVTIFADRTQKHSLGAVGYDDEGVPAKRWDLIKDGVLVNYQATRDQVHILGEKESQGCSYADSWSSVQFQRMPNVSLAAGKAALSPAQMVGDVQDGIYIIGRGSYSIDQQRYNAQFGGQLFYEIKGGKVTHMIEDVAYQIRTPEFWNACSAVCDQTRLPHGRLVLRRQGPAVAGLGGFARSQHRTLQGHQRHQHRAQPRLSTSGTQSGPHIGAATWVCSPNRKRRPSSTRSSPCPRPTNARRR